MVEKKYESALVDPESMLKHAKSVKEQYIKSPKYIACYLQEVLKNNGLGSMDHPAIHEVKNIIIEAKNDPQTDAELHEELESAIQEKNSHEALEQASWEIRFRKEIEDYYLPKQLVNAIMEKGEIPKKSVEQLVGIGFIDIANYTYLSKFLTPMENQIVLNGLYAVFNWVLKRHGGYLNKIEGDSIMFHYGGNIDPKVKGLSEEEAERYIAKELFYTCVEMQRVAFHFNEANTHFFKGSVDINTWKVVEEAFNIISIMRTNSELSQAINAFFQIRIRIGANLGVVTIGNFGPDGARQWDVIGMPVILAKRMEATAPIGGFRITEHFYKILEKNGLVDEYFHRFKREADALFGIFRDITLNELFKFATVRLKDKKDVSLNTYSVQVNPSLPEALMKQGNLLLDKGVMGADFIIQMLQYYRGNRFVIRGFEQVFKEKNIQIRKTEIYRYMFPRHYHTLMDIMEHNEEKMSAEIEQKFSLFELFDMLGALQDSIKFDSQDDRPPPFEFYSYKEYMEKLCKWIEQENNRKEKRIYQRTYFFEYVFPMVFNSIYTSILEYQVNKEEGLEELSEEINAS